MGVESYTSLESGALFRMGTQRELINMRGAQLHLIDGEESVLITSGDFSLKLLKQANSPLAVVVASVGELQWPIGKDAPVLKVWNRRYTFALPDLVYGLILPESTQVGALQHLESILDEYSTFETHHEIANSVQFATNGRRNDPGFWTAVALEVETLSSRIARNIDSASTVVANSTAVIGSDWTALGIRNSFPKRKDSDHNEGAVSPRMMKRMQQARRMSAVAKLVSRTLIKGAISATGHVTKSLGFDMNGTTRSGPIYGVETPRNVAVASVDAFGKVVEAVETAGKSLHDGMQKVGTELGFGADSGLQGGFGAYGNAVTTAWTLNKAGLRMLLRMTAASTALTSRSGTAKSATSSVTSLRGDQSVSTGSTRNIKQSRSAPDLQHEITLSPSERAQPAPQSGPAPPSSQPASQSVAWNLIPSSGQQLHTSQFFTTSAEQMRNQVARLPSPAHSFMPPGNFTSIAAPGQSLNSPFQQYHNLHLTPSPVSFSFQPQANLQME